jgi:hypothetical protein
MFDNKLMDKFTLGFNEVTQEMQTRIHQLDSEISKLNCDKRDAENELAIIISSIEELVQIKFYWMKKYSDALRSGGDTDYAFSNYQKADMLLLVTRGKPNSGIPIEVKAGKPLLRIRLEDIYSNSNARRILQEAEKTFPKYNKRGKHATQEKLDNIQSNLYSLTDECDLLKNKLDNLLTLPIEQKAEAYYDWLVEQMQAAKSEKEYTVLTKKFSNINEYKDCAELAEECKKLAEIQAKIGQLDKELTEFKKSKPEKKIYKWYWIGNGTRYAWVGAIVFIVVSIIEGVSKNRLYFGDIVGGAIAGGIVGLIIKGLFSIVEKIIQSFFYDNAYSNEKNLYDSELQKKTAEIENQKAALRSEYKKIKDEIIKTASE